MSEAYRKLEKFVDTSATLAEQLQVDIKKDRKISAETIVALSKFLAAYNAFDPLLAMLQKKNVRTN